MIQNWPRSLGYFTDLQVRLSEGSIVERRESYWKIETPQNPTFYWGNFLLFDEMAEDQSAKELLDTFRSELPTAQHVAIGFDEPNSEVSRFNSLVSKIGVELECSAILTSSPSEPSRLDVSSAEVRQIETPQDWEQYVEVGMSVRDIRFDEAPYRVYLKDGNSYKRRAQESGKAAWLGVFSDQVLVSALGIYDCGSGIARYQKIETTPGHQRKGFASLLIREAARYAETNFNTELLVIAADPDDHPINLYRKLGFTDRESQVQLQRQPQ